MEKTWFDDPGLDGPTALVVEDSGRVYGHLAVWGTCHVGIPGACVTPPRNSTGYRYFHLGDRGGVDVGQITLNTGHPALTLGAQAAVRHYDDTGTAVADVRAGEDAWGIWVAGTLREDVDEAVVTKLRGAKLSGDWREINGQLEMVAALAVNVPGFPVPRTRARVASAGAVALVASGIVPRSEAVRAQARERLVAAIAERQVVRQQLSELLERARVNTPPN